MGVTRELVVAVRSGVPLARISQTRNIKLHLAGAEIVKNGIRTELFGRHSWPISFGGLTRRHAAGDFHSGGHR